MSQVFFCGIIDKETGSTFNHRNDLRSHLIRDRRAAKRRTHHTIFFQDAGADISCTMDYNSAAGGIIVKALVHTLDAKGKAIETVVSVARDIESEAALARFHSIGERTGIFLAGIDPMRYKRAVQQATVADVDHIKALIARRLAKVTDGENASTVKHAFLFHFIITGPGTFEGFTAKAGIFKAHFIINAGSHRQDHALLGALSGSFRKVRYRNRVLGGGRSEHGNGVYIGGQH